LLGQERIRLERITQKEREGRKQRFSELGNYQHKWEEFPTQSPICGGNDGLPSELDRITFSKWRRESIKGYGNAIVPQVVYQIFKSIQEYENLLSINCKKL
jgi:DNA (cytosine-5)-methyltransferase 1